MANQVVSIFGVVKIKLKTVLEEIVHTHGSLGKEIKGVLETGGVITGELAVEAILFKLEQADVARRGFVLVDFPQTLDQAHLLNKAGVVLHPIFYMAVPMETAIARNKAYPRYSSDLHVLQHRTERVKANLREIVGWYSNAFHSVKYLDATKSKWYISDTVRDAINEVKTAKYNYAIRLIKQLATDITQLNASRFDIRARHSAFGSYCPVMWSTRNELHYVQDFSYVAEYFGLTYQLSSQKALAMFLDDPKRFLKTPLSEHLPKTLAVSEASEIRLIELFMQGYCPVTLKEKGEVRKGNSMLLAAYRNRIYAFSDRFHRQRFMFKPFEYYDVLLTREMIPKEPKQVRHPEEYENQIEYLEDYLGEAVYKAMLDLGDNRLCYPTLSLRETALKYFAIYLKATNPKNTAYLNQKYARMLNAYKTDCKLPEIIFREGKRKLALEDSEGWFEWDDNYYFNKVEEYDQLIDQIENSQGHFFKFIR